MQLAFNLQLAEGKRTEIAVNIRTDDGMTNGASNIKHWYIWCIFIGDFNVNWLIQKDKAPLHNLFVRDHDYRQLVSCYTTDNRTTIDHIYTNLPESEVKVHILETFHGP